MTGPLLRMETRTSFPSRAVRRVSRPAPSASMNLTALSTMLVTTWLTRLASPMTISGSSASATSTSMRFSSMRPSKLMSVRRMSSLRSNGARFSGNLPDSSRDRSNRSLTRSVSRVVSSITTPRYFGVSSWGMVPSSMACT